MQIAEDENNRNGEGIVVGVLSVLLLITLGLAAAYGLRYGNIDESVVPGDAAIVKDDVVLVSMHVNDDFSADIEYLNFKMSGILTLAGAEKDTILYQLKKVSFDDGADASDAVLFVRIPRTGLQGDFSGPWMLYFSCPSQSNVMQSEWIVAEQDGTAKVGSAAKMNAITAQRSTLMESSTDWRWEKDGQTLSVTSE